MAGGFIAGTEETPRPAAAGKQEKMQAATVDKKSEAALKTDHKKLLDNNTVDAKGFFRILKMSFSLS
jgi:hypothetical protein